jgi:glucose-1-phosphate adenylyltransferase
LQSNLPPPKFVFGSDGDPHRRGQAIDSLVSPGTIVSGGTVQRSVISPNVRVNSYASVENSIIFEGVNIGRHARVRRAIIDKNVNIPPGMEIGFDLDLDRRRGFTISPSGIVVISRNDNPSTDLDNVQYVDPPVTMYR